MTKKTKLQTPSGMHDILPKEWEYYNKIFDVVSGIAEFYGFGRIETPILEKEELFSKGVGQSTDIVEKEMYTLKTKGGDSLVMRPEMTAPIARSYIEQGMKSWPQPVKLWYFGPCFRHERQQAGRYRQFWQFGFEILGEQSPVVDAQIIQIFWNILEELKLKDLIVEINSIGDSQCRPYYKKLLKNYFRSRKKSLCSDCKKRLKDNVLRILDCKQEKCQPLKANAPQGLDNLCDDCKDHLKKVLEFLDEIDLPYRLTPNLVRGLDYYTKTVFEIFYEEEGGKSLALAGGGRYDRLVKLLGGKETPASGAAAGIERVVELMKGKEIKMASPKKPQIFLAQLGDLAKRKSLKLSEELRKSNIRVVESFGRDSLKSQLNRANKSEVPYTLIIGQQEALEDAILIRDMDSGKQEEVKLDKVVKEVKKKLKKKK